MTKIDGDFLFGIKVAGFEADHSPICIAELKMRRATLPNSHVYFVHSPVLKILNLEITMSTRLTNKCTKHFKIISFLKLQQVSIPECHYRGAVRRLKLQVN
jgi:hypothetical protein